MRKIRLKRDGSFPLVGVSFALCQPRRPSLSLSVVEKKNEFTGRNGRSHVEDRGGTGTGGG